MVSKAQGVFLWVVLVVSMLNENFDQVVSAKQLKSTLNTTPEDLDGLFSDILSKGASDPYLLPALQSVIARVDSQTFRVAQLYFMVLISADKLTSPIWDHEQSDMAMMKRFILQSTKGLVEIASHDGVYRIQFVHESVRQYLLEGGLTKLYVLSGEDVEASCHAKLADYCQTYIRLIGHEQLPIEHLTQHRLADQGAALDMDLPLLNYTKKYTMWQVKCAHAAGVYEVKSLLHFPVAIWIKIDRYFQPVTSRLQPSARLLYVLVEERCFTLAIEILGHYKTRLKNLSGASGVQRVRNHLIDTLVGPDLNAPQGRRSGQTILMAAAKAGHSMTVKLLLECGADINFVIQGGASALSLAVASSRVDVVRLLLDSGANIDQEYGHLGYPLVTAIRARIHSVAMVELLLEHAADVNVIDRNYGTALMVAASMENLDAMQLLLLHGADPNILNDSGICGTALTTAAVSGDVEMTKLLLLHGADVDLVSERGTAPLSSSMRRFVLSCRETEEFKQDDQLHIR